MAEKDDGLGIEKGAEVKVGLPGEPLLDNLPILQKLNDGPISRILKSVDEKSPQDAVATLDDDGLEVEVDNQPATTGQSINLTIREIKFKDPPIYTKEDTEPSDTNDAQLNNVAPDDDQVVISARDDIQDIAAVELKLASCDTNVQVPDSSPSHIDALACGIVDEVADLCTLQERHEYDQCPGQVSAVAEEESQLQQQREQENEDEVATLIAEECRRSNDWLQQAVATTGIAVTCLQEEETIDGLIANDQLEQEQQAFEVELVEEKDGEKSAEGQRVHTVIANNSGSVSVANSGVKEEEGEVTVVSAQVEVLHGKDQADEENVLDATAVEPAIITTDCIQDGSDEDALVNCEDNSVDVVLAEIGTVKETVPADECLKITNESVICRSSDLVTRIASYYSTQDEDEGNDDEEDDQTKRPPVPLKTYQWEDIRRAKQQGGYPWTHLYKPPLGPEDEPELLQRIRTLPKQRKRFEQKLIDSGGSLKRVRIDNAVLVQETEKYIQSLDDNNNDVVDSYFLLDANEHGDVPETESLAEEELEEEVKPEKTAEEETTTEDIPKSPLKRRKSFRKGLRKLNPTRLLRRTPKVKDNDDQETKTVVVTNTTTNTSEEPLKSKSKILCHPIVVKLRELARRQIRRTPSKTNSDSHLKPTQAMSDERQQILQLRESPKAGGREIGAYIERHESDEVVEVIQLEESPGEMKRRKGKEQSTHVQPDEIMHLPESDQIGAAEKKEIPDDSVEPTISELLEEELKNEASALPPKKVARRQKEHYYEDIDDDDDPNEHLNFTLMTPEMMNSTQDVPNIDLTLIGASGELMKSSLANQDNQLLHEMADREKRLSDLFVSQSSGEDEDHPVKVVADVSVSSASGRFLLAPISSVDSASSEDERKVPLTPVAEESDRESIQMIPTDSPEDPIILSPPLDVDERKEDVIIKASEDQTISGTATLPVSEHEDSKEDEANALVSSVLETAVHVVNDRWRGMSDHEYEPIGQPNEEYYRNSPSPNTEHTRLSLSPSKKTRGDDADEEQVSIQDIQDEIENRYFALTPTTTGSRTDCEVHTSCVDSSAIEDLPLDRGSRRSWNVGERSKQMQQRFKTGAGKLKTKLKGIHAPKTGSPKEQKKKFKTPEFTKLKGMALFQKKSQPPEEITTTTTTVVVSADTAQQPTILVSDTTVEVEQKPTTAAKTSFASKFKIPNIKEKFSKSSEPAAETPPPPPSDFEDGPQKTKTSIFKKFEFKSKQEPITKTSETVEFSAPALAQMDSITPESETRSSGSPLTPEPPVTPDCYEVQNQDEPPVQSPSAAATKTSRFKAPDLSRIKDFKRPQFTKFEFKRPEFHRPKFSKPDMSRFKIPQRFHSLRLKRTKSMKESTSGAASTTDSEPVDVAPKKKFDFGTYPRIFSKMRKGSTGGAISKAGRPSTPTPPIIFTTQATSDGTSENDSRGAAFDNESGSYQKYGVHDPEFDRETSVERRMREHFSKSVESEGEVPTGIMQTEEQRQINSFNEENRAIHEISHARRGEFEQRKPFVHQDSDLVSEDSAGAKWAQQMEITDDDKLAEQAMINRLLQHDIELAKQNDLDRRSLPQSNKDTISSGSASDRQRTNVIEEIDDDEFFLRSKGISQDNIRIGEYISSAIREGLTNKTENSLAQVGVGRRDYGNYYDDDDQENNEPMAYGYEVEPPPRRPRRKTSEDKRRSPVGDEDDEFELQHDFNAELKANEDDGYFTVGPNRPARRRQQSGDRYESSELAPEERDNRSLYDNDSEIIMMDEEFARGGAYQHLSRMPPTPPKVPKRKKKMVTQMMRRIEKMDGFTGGRSVSNSVLPNAEQPPDNIVVYRTEFEIPPIATPEKFTPVPTPRRSRSRSQLSRFTDDDRTSRGAESLVSDAHDHHHHQQKNVLDLQKNGYAVIKKDPPPRPPAPLRRKRSTKSLGNDRQFHTMPHPRKASSPPPPPRPNRNYSTIVPMRPPRTKSNSSLGDAVRPTKSSPDVTEYEEIGTSRDLQSGAIVKKMKDRPLPPPPRPDRTLPRRKKDEQPKDDNSKPDDDFDDRDGGGERIDAIDSTGSATVDHQQQLSFDEVDISTQTEPLPDDFVCDELDISADMKTITPTQSKTLEEILKEEQEAEFERAQQQVAEISLTRGLQRFRDANQRSMSEKSWASRDRPKTPSSLHLSSAQRLNVSGVTSEEAPQQSTEQRPEKNAISAPVQRADEDNRNVMEDEPPAKNDTKILNLEMQPPTAEVQEEEKLIPETPPEQFVQNVESEIERRAQQLENIIDRLSSEGSPPPVAPPRRKSSAGDPRLTNDLSNRLQWADMEVNRLNVHQLNAGNITAENITTTDRGHGMGEISQDVIDQITERILSSDQMQSRTTATQPQPPAGFFAIPTDYLNSIPPPSFYQLRDPTEDEEKKTKSSTESDPKEGTSTEAPPSVVRLGGQFLSACGSAFMRNVRELIKTLPSSLTNEENRRDVNVILLILIIIIVCLLAFAMGGSRTIHHHHWDFYNPPGDIDRLD